MKVEKTFVPLVITVETKDDLDFLFRLIAVAEKGCGKDVRYFHNPKGGASFIEDLDCFLDLLQ